MAVDNGKRIIDQDTALGIYLEDNIIIDSATNGTRRISYEALCNAVAVTLGIAAIRTTANGALQKTVYDANANGIVDNAEKLENHSASYFATAAALTALSETVSGKMDKSVYDSNNDGIVDNAAKVNNHTVHSDVPPQAVFTDTVYDDTEIKAEIGNLNNLQTSDKTSLVAAVNVAHTEAVTMPQTERGKYISTNSSGIMIAKMDGANTYAPNAAPSGLKNIYIDSIGVHERDGTTVLRTVTVDGDEQLALDTNAAASTTDGALYAAITALGWASDVII